MIVHTLQTHIFSTFRFLLFLFSLTIKRISIDNHLKEIVNKK